ncbi:MAG: tRNA lysidine(34) synthetase TilS [Candidatus Omnitrophica bacterium]|nr:tRNA lysidine(34) synthetase TilS [Candidatus Omnitrophota bacterium]MDD5771069.1 tRNA lysidine(34) synthetase TilS [Candidatus Omnitrophota bacterium]
MQKVKETIRKYRLLRKGDKILVCVSGGPDSLALLIELYRLIPALDLDLHIAHVDHGLRKGSLSDALFVKELGGRLDLPVSSIRLDSLLKKKKGSLEEICRQARQDFFISLAKKIKADKIAVGHNIDDQAETVLMRILRGTGLSGLSGISVKRKIRGITFIRPLLETSRKQIERFLKRERIKPRIDPTNRKDIFFRNKIRNRLIPLLKKEYSRNITGLLSGLAENISYDYEYLDRASERALKGNSLRLDLKKLSRLHKAILRLRLRRSISYIQGDTRRISLQHIRELEDLLDNRPAGSIVDLPNGISAQKTRTALRFYKR